MLAATPFHSPSSPPSLIPLLLSLPPYPSLSSHLPLSHPSLIPPPHCTSPPSPPPPHHSKVHITTDSTANCRGVRLPLVPRRREEWRLVVASGVTVVQGGGAYLRGRGTSAKNMYKLFKFHAHKHNNTPHTPSNSHTHSKRLHAPQGVLNVHTFSCESRTCVREPQRRCCGALRGRGGREVLVSLGVWRRLWWQSLGEREKEKSARSQSRSQHMQQITHQWLQVGVAIY